jgi:hypothetical protein
VFFSKDFDWVAVNYAPLMVGGMFIIVGLWWLISAKNTFTGPRHTVAELDAELGEDHTGGDLGGGGPATAPAGA